LLLEREFSVSVRKSGKSGWKLRDGSLSPPNTASPRNSLSRKDMRASMNVQRLRTVPALTRLVDGAYREDSERAGFRSRGTDRNRA
jgi:hypothetical protein